MNFKQFDLIRFISENITYRDKSIFSDDIEKNYNILKKEIKNKNVLVIGGAGTIGKNFIKSLLSFNPKKLIVVDKDENGLTELTRDLRSNPNINMPNNYMTYPIDFSSSIFFEILSSKGPFEIVANFAAHKHVRSEKDEFSILAMIENNIIKAKLLLDRLKNPPKHFFCVSTDKATNPVNLMGATKKLMEEMIMAYGEFFPVTTARFANVAFSQGSLLDGFISRIMKKQPISAPYDVKRYFVSPEESGQLCLLACVMGKSCETFFPIIKSSQMLTFSKISDRLLDSLGYKPINYNNENEAKLMSLEINKNSNLYPVYYFKSDTSGEKQFEEFYSKDENVDLNLFLHWEL